MMVRHRPAQFAEQHAGLLLSAAVIASLLIVSLLSGSFGKIGPDGDDVMRLVQVRDLLNGQGWFDLVQPRLGPEGGTLMHWSRLVDLPMAAIANSLSPFIGQDAALRIAYTFWPQISVLIVTCALVAGARALGGRTMLLFACLLGFAVLFRHFRFLPGAIDHHNLQLGLLMLAASCLLVREHALAMALGGAALALAAAIGAEVHLFIVLVAGFVAVDWAITGEPAQRGAAVFGASFAAVLTATFLATVPPLDYGVARCDAHDSVTLLAGLAGGVAFALAVQITSQKSMALRFAALANVGAICAALVMVTGPQCLSNPLDSLSVQARDLWLARVDEARPTLVYLRSGQLDEFLFRLGTPLAGLAAAAWLAWRRDQPRAQLLFVVLLTVSVLLSLYQTRFYVFGQLFAVLPLAVLAARVEAGRLGAAVPRLSYPFLLLLSVPTMWSFAGAAFSPPPAPRADRLAAAACNPPAAYAALAVLPEGRVLAPATDAPSILLSTAHSALYGHYHRNRAGIDAALAIFTSPPDAARPRLAAAKVDYLMVCPADIDMRFFADYAPDGLVAGILAGDVPEWLAPVVSAGATTIYRVKAD